MNTLIAMICDQVTFTRGAILTSFPGMRTMGGMIIQIGRLSLNI